MITILNEVPSNEEIITKSKSFNRLEKINKLGRGFKSLLRKYKEEVKGNIKLETLKTIITQSLNLLKLE